MRKMKLCTLCYIERDDKYLMLHRVSPDECLIREVREETGYELKDFDFRGIVTFVYGKKNEEFIEYMHLFVGRNVVGEPIECNEGVLRWVDKKEVLNLNLWEGDRIFLRLLEERKDFFSLKLVYGEDESLKEAVLDGKSLDI